MKDEVIGVGRNKSSTVVKYQKDHYNTLSLRFKKEDEVLRLLDYASKTLGITKGDYVREALMKQFKHDGLSIDMLPTNSKYTPPAPEPKQPRRYMIYTITERWAIDDDDAPDKYVAIFPTLKAAEKYARNKFERKAYPADWTYIIYGRYMEGDNQRDAWDKLKVLVKNELETDRENHGKDDNGLYWLDRIERDYPADYSNKIECEDGNAKSEFDDLEFFDFSDIEEGESFSDEDEGGVD